MSDGKKQENGKSFFERLQDPSMLRTLFLTIISLVAFLIIWQLASDWLNLAYLPPPGQGLGCIGLIVPGA